VFLEQGKGGWYREMDRDEKRNIYAFVTESVRGGDLGLKNFLETVLTEGRVAIR